MGLLGSVGSEMGAASQMQMPKAPKMPKPPQAPKMPKAPQVPGMPGGSGSAEPAPDSSLEPSGAVGVARWINIGSILLVIFTVTIAISQEVGYGMPPSELGVFQRFALFGVCAAPILNLLKGMRPQHYGIALIVSLAGLFFSGKEVIEHATGQLTVDPNEVVLGRPMFEWAFATFILVILGVGIMLIWTQSWLALDYGLVHHYGPSRTWAFASMIWLGCYILFTLVQVPVQCGWWCPADPTSSGGKGWQFSFAITNASGADATISISAFVAIMLGIGMLSLIAGSVMNHKMISQLDGKLS